MDFLQQRSQDAVKREIRSILDSYHHYWDPLAELLQNARDAIDRCRKEDSDRDFFILVKVDSASRTIEVLDNGTGIAQDRILDVLAPGGGDKSNRDEEVGEKGVGLTYTIFCGDEFEIESNSQDSEHFCGSVANARSWLDKEEVGAPPAYEEKESSSYDFTEGAINLDGGEFPLDTFTKVRVASLPLTDESDDLFNLSGPQLKYLLQTRTAVGVTDRLFADDFTPNFRVFYELRLKDSPEGASGELDVGFPPPHSYLAKHRVLDDVTSAFVSRTTEKKRRRYLKDTGVWARTEIKNGQETIRVYGVMMPGNANFPTLAKNSLKVDDPDKDSDEIVDSLFRSGIFLGTKGMPTGVEIPYGPGGKYPAYYRRCLFLVESDTIKFDMGRKSMHYKPRSRLQKAVTDLFLVFESLAGYQSDEKAPASAQAKPTETKAERDARIKEEWETHLNLVDLKVDSIAYEKEPYGQEAAVAAIFHELLGAGLLKDYRPVGTGYSSQYDLRALYNDVSKNKELQLVVEFKHSLESVVKDFEEDQKRFDDIHLFVAWDANKQKLKNAGFDLDEVSVPAYNGVTHELSTPALGLEAVPVILLEDFLKKIREEQQ